MTQKALPRLAVLAVVLMMSGRPAEVVAQDVPGENQGRLIQIGPDRGANGDRSHGDRLRQPGFRQPGFRQPGFRESAPSAVSRFWIGVAGGTVPAEVRAHIDLEDGEGVLLRSIEPESPAAEGGLLAYDIVTRVDGEPLVDMRQLANAVGEAGEKKARMTLEVIRQGRPATVWVAPVERPIAPRIEPGFPDQRFGAFRGANPFAMGQLPGGLSIAVTQSGDEPAKIVVRRGEETWEIEADDKEAVAALPEDIRPFVERALAGRPLEAPLGAFGRQEFGEIFGRDFGERFPDFAPDDVQQRLFEMERQVEALRRRFGNPEPAPPAAPAEPQDIEIPAEN